MLLEKLAMIKNTHFKVVTIIFIIILTLVFLPVNSQNKIFSGIVEDLNTGEKIAGASIIETSSHKNVITNNYGFFSITSSNNFSVYLIYSFGYMPKTVSLLTSMKMPLIIKLTPNNDKSFGVIANGLKNDITKNSILLKLNVKETKTLPSLLGETDILKVAQLMPGITYGNEGISNLVVRGGNSDENTILLDGVPIISSTHLLGFYSIFNSDGIRDFKIYKGSFPASYGGSLSSVTEIFMKDGDVNNYHGFFNLGPLSSKLTLEGPISKGNSSLLISGSKSYLGLTNVIFKNFMENIGANGCNFYDINGKFTIKISNRNRISFSQYISNDNSQINEINNNLQFTSSNNERLARNNYLSALRWSYLLSDNMFLNVIASFSYYRFQNSTVNNYTHYANPITQNNDSVYSKLLYAYKMNSQIYDYRLKTEFSNYIRASNQLNYGVSISRQQLNPTIEYKSRIASDENTLADSSVSNLSYSIIDAFLYAEDIFHLTPKIDITGGVNVSYYNTGSKIYISPNPRFNVLYRPSQSFTFNGSVSQMEQHSHILSFSKLNDKSDFHVSSTDKIEPSKALQADLGSSYTFLNFIIGTGLYYKTIKQLIELKDGASNFDVQTDWQNKVGTGKGTAYGIELFVQKNEGKFTGFISYTLSQSKREFANFNLSKPFSFDYDKTHQLNTNVIYKITNNITVNTLWIFSTGSPYSMNALDKSSIYASIPFSIDYGYTEMNLSNRNNFRFPYYHRLDLGISYVHSLKYAFGTLSFGCYNVYNRKNVNGYTVETIKNANSLRDIPPLYSPKFILLTRQYLSQILPYISYRISF